MPQAYSIKLLLLMLLLSGCAAPPPAPPPEPESEPVVESAAAADVAAETQMATPDVNPYLLDPTPVPAQVTREFSQIQQQLADAPELALSALHTLAEQHPQLSGLWYHLALYRQQQGQPEAALSAVQHALAVNPANLDGWNLQGILQRQQGQFSEAEQSYQQALKRWQNYAPAHLNLAILYDLYLGQPQQALSHYQAYQALQAEPRRDVKGWIVLLERQLEATSQ